MMLNRANRALYHSVIASDLCKLLTRLCLDDVEGLPKSYFIKAQATSLEHYSKDLRSFTIAISSSQSHGLCHVTCTM